MKTTQYIRQEKAIAAADAGGIWQRWIWGLRLLHDPEAMSSEKSLRHGVTDQLIKAATKAGLKLSSREIARRLQCARIYPTEGQMFQAIHDFGCWSDLLNAGFPAYEAAVGEPPADYRTVAERAQDRARGLGDLVERQGAAFPLRTFEPIEALLKELQEYAEQQEELTARFLAHGQKRREYLDSLIEAAEGDLSMTWQAAQDRLEGAVS
jgi:hypothetical protein